MQLSLACQFGEINAIEFAEKLAVIKKTTPNRNKL